MEPRPTLGQSRLPLSVSTRSMARLASSSTSSNLARPTLSSSRKASTTLRRPGQLPSSKRVILGETTLNPSASGSHSPKLSLGGKRKAGDDGSGHKKVRLNSPGLISRKKLKYPTTPLRHGLTTPRKLGGGTTPKFTAGWVHPLAHTPNRVHTPTSEGNSISSDEMALGDSPVGMAEKGEGRMKSIAERRQEADDLKRKEEDCSQFDLGDRRDEGMEADLAPAPTGSSSLHGSLTPLQTAKSNSSTAQYQVQPTESPHPIFRLTTLPSDNTSPTHSPPPGLGSSSLFPKTTFSLTPGAPNTISSLAPPASPYTIAPSPRKGLSSVSRFGVARQIQTVQTTLAFRPVPKGSSETAAQTSSTIRSDIISDPTSASSTTSLNTEDIEMDSLEPFNKATSAVNSDTSRKSMLPPSRIPVRSTKPTLSGRSTPSLSTTTPSIPSVRSQPSQPSQLKRSALGNLGVAAQRPSRPPSTSDSTSIAKEPIVHRKPSYPSSLGSGPLIRPRDRQISVPVPSHIIEPILRDVPDTSNLPTSASPRSPGLRSVSAPMPRNSNTTERQSLSLSTRREGWMDTSRSLHGLSEALERLKVKKEILVEPTKRPSLASSTARSSLAALTVGEAGKENVLNPRAPTPTPTALSSSSRLSAVHRSRYSMLGSGITGATPVTDDGDVSMDASCAGDKSLAAIMVSNAGTGCLKGVVAFVDVRTADGSDSSGIFAEMLRGLGARVLSRPSESITHIIYKSGKPTTLSWYRKQEEDCRPHIVGLSWVTRSKEAGKRLEEGKFKVEVGEEDVFAKRRKSMEPKSLSFAALSSSIGPRASMSVQSSVAEAKRKSLIHAPKIGSPLKKGYRRDLEEDDF